MKYIYNVLKSSFYQQNNVDCAMANDLGCITPFSSMKKAEEYVFSQMKIDEKIDCTNCYMEFGLDDDLVLIFGDKIKGYKCYAQQSYTNGVRYKYEIIKQVIE